MKIHILGGPGSGKTTLARSIATQFNTPHYDLDQFYRKYGATPSRYLEESRAVAQQTDWVTEGIYLLIVDPLLEQADYILLLDVPWSTAAWRMVKRHVIKTIQGTNEYPGLKLLHALLSYARTYYLNQRPDTTEIVQAYFDEYGAAPKFNDSTLLTRLETYPSLVIPPTSAFVRRYLEPYRDKVLIVKNNADQKRLFTLLTNGCPENSKYRI